MEHVFGHEKEGNPAICDIMMNPEGIMIKWNKPDKVLHDLPYVWNLEKSN